MRRVKAVIMSAAVVIGTAVGGTASASGATSSAVHESVTASGEHVTVVNVERLRYRYNGHVISQHRLYALQAKHLALFVGVDATSARAGVAHAFDTKAALDAFSSKLTGRPAADFASPTKIETPAQRAARLRADGAPASLVAAAAHPGQATLAVHPDGLIGACPALSYGSQDYDNSNCGGSELSMGRNDQEPDFGVYGHNDKTSSVDIQYSGCVTTAQFYNDKNYVTVDGVWDYYGIPEDYASYNFNSAQNDKASSEKATC